MIGSRGHAVENASVFTLTLAWQGGQGQVVTVPPGVTVPVPITPATAGLFGGHVVGVLGAGGTVGLWVGPEDAWVRPQVQALSPPPGVSGAATLVATGTWEVDVPPGVSKSALAGDSRVQVVRTPTRLVVTPTPMSMPMLPGAGAGATVSLTPCPSPVVHVTTPTQWTAVVAGCAIIVLVVAIVCAVGWAKADRRGTRDAATALP
jgi:hypothetical protein